jgi:hypothetical protein
MFIGTVKEDTNINIPILEDHPVGDGALYGIKTACIMASIV